MHLTKAGILAIIAFSTATFANIYPDEDPCNPAPALEGEYQGEFETRMDLADARCSCEFPPPAAGEAREEFDERNRIDSGRCPGGPPPVPYFDPGPLPDIGPIIVPIPVGGFGFGVPNWRESRGWRNPRWRPGPNRPGGRHFDRHPPRPRGPINQPFRGNRGGNRGPGGFNPGPHRDPPRFDPPHREPPRPQPHREPPRPQPHRPEPHREPPRPNNNNNNHGGRPGGHP